MDFVVENLKLLKDELRELDIPLAFLDVLERDGIVPRILQFIKDNNTSHVFAIYEYEVDELRRDIRLSSVADDGEFQALASP